MNILIFSWRGPGHPQEGGAEQVTHEHAKAWIKAGHSVTLFTSYFASGKRKEEIDGVEVIRSGRQMLGVQISGFLWSFFKKHPKYDLVVDQFHGIPFFTPLYVKAKKLAFIHEVTREVWKLNQWPKPYYYLPAFIGLAAEPLIFKIFYKKIPFMTVSESTRDDLIKWSIPKANITIVHNGVLLDLPKMLPQKEKIKTATFLGALSADKGIDDALKIFSEIYRKDEDWQFWVIGRGSDEYIFRLKSLSKKLGIADKVKYWGFVDEKMKFELLAKSHVLINTSYREGWSLVNIEANAVGTPVLGYNVPGVRDSVKNGKTGILSELGGVHDVAVNALKLVSDENTYRKYQKDCISWSKKFTWEKAGKESLELIESL
jgi:glycosyltransferase involved in cell wall biosynthesis